MNGRQAHLGLQPPSRHVDCLLQQRVPVLAHLECVPAGPHANNDHLKDEYGVGAVVHYPAVWTWDAVRDLGYCEEQANCPIAAKA